MSGLNHELRKSIQSFFSPSSAEVVIIITIIKLLNLEPKVAVSQVLGNGALQAESRHISRCFDIRQGLAMWVPVISIPVISMLDSILRISSTSLHSNEICSATAWLSATICSESAVTSYTPVVTISSAHRNMIPTHARTYEDLFYRASSAEVTWTILSCSLRASVPTAMTGCTWKSSFRTSPEPRHYDALGLNSLVTRRSLNERNSGRYSSCLQSSPPP